MGIWHGDNGMGYGMGDNKGHGYDKVLGIWHGDNKGMGIRAWG
jgi:hypothetical protein